MPAYSPQSTDDTSCSAFALLETEGQNAGRQNPGTDGTLPHFHEMHPRKSQKRPVNIPSVPMLNDCQTAMRAKTVVTGGYFYGYGARAEESPS